MKSCFDIVPLFLTFSTKGAKGGMTPLKLQKLLYYSQAWHLVLTNEPLFYEDIEAWVHGPVVPSVYQEYKQYGYSNILHQEASLDNYLDSDELSTMDIVWNLYGSKKAKFLEYLTHSEDPWLNARCGLASDRKSNRKISRDDMKKYYLQFVDSFSPLKINSSALSLEEKKKNMKTRQNILGGMSSVLDIYPAPRKSRQYYFLSDFRNELSDFEALESDWERIGSDFMSTIESVKDKKYLKNGGFYRKK